MSITLPQEYIYPLAGVLSTFYVLFFQVVRVGGARKAAGIKYPQLYAEKAEAQSNREARLFNCVQRAHQNTLENLPTALFSTLVAGLVYPRFAGCACAFWSVARIIYTIGYGSGDPAARNLLGANVMGSLTQYTLLLTATWSLVKLAIA
ncbi:membrane-associated proteins in eicosanoid and glutathione metabolism [Irpex rosettiformis]|uniref:Membrane-associated proteins in eicosanoid and glutathione metabolism n=1 Tax=Irpex rosettiformis TaxID=378272 RepID=A0ACB8UIQ7_9APHY|nr:membrane-associated proteins in eicosanoid and glutathione metabolism [Irpex rosettiformis]